MLPEYDYAAFDAEEREQEEHQGAEQQNLLDDAGDRQAQPAPSAGYERQRESVAPLPDQRRSPANGFPALRGRPTRAQQRAREIARLQEEQKLYEQSVQQAVKHAAFARCDAVEQLYEILGVEPEEPIVRSGKKGPYQVQQDRDETKRADRLVQAVLALQELAAGVSASAPAPAHDG